MRTASRIALLMLLGALFDCTTFASLPANSCGNGVIDNGEDCDSFSVGATACRGSSSAVGACRLDCSSTACPTGWGCGTDFICRQPSGRFTRQPNAIAAGAWRVQTGDFDGDHRQDVLTREPIDPNGLSKLRLHFFDGNALLSKTLIVPPSLAYPRVLDMNGDKLADLVFANPGVQGIDPGGVGTMLGQSDRTLSAVAYPTFTFPGAARALAVHGLPNATTSFAFFVKDPRGTVVAGTDANQNPVVLTMLPGSPDDIAGDPRLARVYEDATQFPCEELVLGFSKATEVLVYPLCKTAGGAVVLNDTGQSALVRVQLTDGAKVDRGVLVTDVNADGHLDILIGVLDGTPAVAKTFIAYGTGGAAFKSDPAGAADGKAAIFRIATKELGEVFEPELPLAVGDMNKDGTPDFVVTQYVLASIGGASLPADAGADGGTAPSDTPTYAIAGRKARGTWTQAAIADFNGNGFPDAIAGANDGLDLDFFNANASALFSTFSLTTDGPVVSFAVGDVDGDYFPDLVFGQTFGGVTGDQLAVAFGRAGGPPEAPTIIGRFEHILQTASFNQGLAVDSVGVVSRPYDPRDGVTTSVSLLEGSGNREPLALFSLTHPKVNLGLPLASVPGAFTKSGSVDVAAFAQDQSGGAYRLWLMRSSGATPPPQFLQAMDGPTLRGDVIPDIGANVTVLLGQGDLNGDGTPEVIVVTPFGALDGSNTQLTIASPRPNDTSVPFDVRDPIVLGIPATQEGQLAIYDVDHDGALDIVLLMGADDAGQLFVYWNDGKGNFDPKNSTLMNLSTEAPTGFSAINVGANEPPALAYVTRKTVVIAHLDSTNRTNVRREKIDAPTDASGIVSGDVDGDGVDDLAIADSNNLVILRGEAIIR